MSDLILEIKNKLRLEDLVRQKFELVPNGRKLRGKDADGLKSLYIDPEKELWTWFAEKAGPGQKALGGDVLDWIALQHFGRVKLAGEEFVELLKVAAGEARIDFEAWQAKHGGNADEAKARSAAVSIRRAKEDVLAQYVAIAEEARTAEFYVRARQIGSTPDGRKAGKTYLTQEVCERWRLGAAPTLKQCTDAGLSEKELRDVMLLRDSEDGPEQRSYMAFRDCVIIPHLERGRVIYLSCRYMTDFDGRGQLRDTKTRHLKTASGLPRPCAFNLDVLYSAEAREKGVLLVEGPLDAIACCEHGHPALSLLGTNISNDLIKRLERCA